MVSGGLLLGKYIYTEIGPPASCRPAGYRFRCFLSSGTAKNKYGRPISRPERVLPPPDPCGGCIPQVLSPLSDSLVPGIRIYIGSQMFSDRARSFSNQEGGPRQRSSKVQDSRLRRKLIYIKRRRRQGVPRWGREGESECTSFTFSGFPDQLYIFQKAWKAAPAGAQLDLNPWGVCPRPPCAKSSGRVCG